MTLLETGGSQSIYMFVFGFRPKGDTRDLRKSPSDATFGASRKGDAVSKYFNDTCGGCRIPLRTDYCKPRLATQVFRSCRTIVPV